MKSINNNKNMCLKKRNTYHKNFKIYTNNSLNNSNHQNFINNVLVRNKGQFLSPSDVSNNPKKKIKAIKSFQRLNERIDSMPNNKYISYETDYSVEKPKIKIRIHSITRNNTNINSISSDTTNNSIKYKIHKIKPYNVKSRERLKTNNKPIVHINIKKKNIGSIQNSIGNSPKNLNNFRNKEYSNINHYYNMIQEKNLIDLNNNIENLIKEQNISNQKSPRNNIFESKIKNIIKSNNEKNKSYNNINNKTVELNNSNNMIYKKKIQKKKINLQYNDYSDTFSKIKYLNLDKENEKKVINTVDKNIKLDNNILTNKNTKTYKLIYDNCQTPHLLTNTSDEDKKFIYYNSKNNSSMVLSPFQSQTSNNFNLKKEQKKKNYIKIESYNRASEFNEKNNIKTSEIINYENIKEKLKVKENEITKNKISNDRNQKTPNFKTIKSNGDMDINSNKLNKMNYYNKNNLSTIINNQQIVANSYSISDFNTFNTLNNSERNINNRNHDLKNKLNLKTMKEKFYRLEYINVKENNNTEQINRKINKSGKKQLKNIITSIECINQDVKKDNQKNVILSEFGKNGKLNIRLKKMNNSIEKVIKDNSSPKKLKVIKFSKLPNDCITYIKKNQGISITKIGK